MIANAVACDYLRLTWFVSDIFDKACAVRDGLFYGGEHEEWRFKQYVGDRLAGIFCGRAEQKGKDHYLLDVAGETADAVCATMSGLIPARCTRLDLQFTAPLANYPGYNTRELTDYLCDIAPERPAISHRENPQTGLNTIYVGSRHSARMWRIYVKPDAECGQWLRFECELSRHVSRQYWQSTFTGDTIERMFASECDRLVSRFPDMPHVGGTLRELATDDRVRTHRDVPEPDIERWIKSVVRPAFRPTGGARDLIIRDFLAEMVRLHGGSVNFGGGVGEKSPAGSKKI